MPRPAGPEGYVTHRERRSTPVVGECVIRRYLFACTSIRAVCSAVVRPDGRRNVSNVLSVQNARHRMLRNFHSLAASTRGIVCVTPDDYVPFRTFRGYGVILIGVFAGCRKSARYSTTHLRDISFSPFEINRHVVIITRRYARRISARPARPGSSPPYALSPPMYSNLVTQEY